MSSRSTFVAGSLVVACAMIFSEGWVRSAAADHRHVGVHIHSGWDYSLRPHCVTNWYGPGWYNSGWYGGPGWYGGLGWGNRPYYSVSGTLVTAPGGGVYSTNYSSFGFSPWSPYFGPGYGVGYSQQTVITNGHPVVVVNRSAPSIRSTRVASEASMRDVMQQHAERRENVPTEIEESNLIRPVSGSSRSGKDRSKLFQAEGDRWLKDGQLTKAYLRYLEAQREAEDRADVYFRQAFTLVAMGRYSHAVLKLKRGLQVDPLVTRSREDLDAIYGVENVVEKTEYLQRVADWTNSNVRDPDRLFLMGVMLHFDNDPRAGEFLQAALKLSGKSTHTQAFLTTASNVVANRVQPAVNEVAPPIADRNPMPRTTPRNLPLPPPPDDDVGITPNHTGRGPRLPQLSVPPQPAPRQLILPDVYLPEENP